MTQQEIGKQDDRLEIGVQGGRDTNVTRNIQCKLQQGENRNGKQFMKLDGTLLIKVVGRGIQANFPKIVSQINI